MKKTIQIIILCFIITACKSQEKEVAYDPIVLKAKETSLYTADVDWQTVNAKFVALTKDATDIDGMKEGLQYLINSLGDKHASVRSAKDHSIIVYYTGERKGEDNLEIDYDFLNTVINDVNAQFSYQFLEDGVGYLRVVGIGPGDVKAQSDFIRNGLKELKGEGVDKWIVDFRFNGGGNMEPMIAGLAPLIGEGFIGGAINPQDEVWEYTIEKGEFSNWGRLVCAMDDLPKIEASEKVAVLLSRYTVSSGEMTAITFKGRPYTRFFGEASGGLTTGNGYDVVTEDIALVISKNIYIDRNKNKYEGRVPVDETIEFQHEVALKEDNTVNSAIAWLKE